jgi:excisionase family DNA binding protein
MTYPNIGAASVNTGDVTAGDPHAAAGSARFEPHPGTYLTDNGPENAVACARAINRPIGEATMTTRSSSTAPVAKIAYSIDDVAELLSLGRTTVVALVSNGEIPSIKVGGRRLIPRRDLDEFVERQRSTPEAT